MLQRLKDVFKPNEQDARDVLSAAGLDLEKMAQQGTEKVLTQMKWDQRFLGLAKHVSSWSKDPSTQVGAVIVDDQQRIVSLGYNGFPSTIDDNPERLNDRETKYELTIHGEINALLFANKPINGFTLYTYPFPPCTRCGVQFIQAGIGRVVSIPAKGELQARWADSIQRSADLFHEAGVTFDLLEMRDE